MKKIILGLILLTSNLFSIAPLECNRCVKIEYLPIYNSPARIETQGCWDINISGSFIYWSPNQVGLDFGILKSKDLNSHSDKVLNLDTDFFPGFRVSLGTNFRSDHWNADIAYTWFHTSDDEHQCTPTWSNGIKYRPIAIIDTFSFIKTKWRQHLDFFDLAIGRAYYNGKNLTIKPNICAKGGWTKQSFNIKGLVQNLTRDILLKNDSWFLGPAVSVDLNWILTCNFRIFFNTAAAALYQKFNNSYRFIIESIPPSILKNVGTKTKQITPNLDLKCGFGWSSYIEHRSWHIDLLIAYDFLYFWNQNEFTAVQDLRDFFNYNASGDLMIHGIEVSLKMNF